MAVSNTTKTGGGLYDRIEDPVTIHLVVPDGDQVTLAVTLVYRTDDPWAVRFRFVGTGVDEQGLDRPIGDGDVRVWPATALDGQPIQMRLTSPDGEALLSIKRDDISTFLTKTYEHVGKDGEDPHGIIAMYLLVLFLRLGVC
jgi:hypothetical protein